MLQEKYGLGIDVGGTLVDSTPFNEQTEAFEFAKRLLRRDN